MSKSKKQKKIRIYEFAREHDKESSEILELVDKLGLDVKQSASAGLTHEQVKKIEIELGDKKSSPLKLAIAPSPAAKKTKKPKKKKPKKKPKKKKKTARKKKAKTAAQVKREAKIRKRKEREAQKRKEEKERRKREKEKKKEEKKTKRKPKPKKKRDEKKKKKPASEKPSEPEIKEEEKLEKATEEKKEQQPVKEKKDEKKAAEPAAEKKEGEPAKTESRTTDETAEEETTPEVTTEPEQEETDKDLYEDIEYKPIKPKRRTSRRRAPRKTRKKTTPKKPSGIAKKEEKKAPPEPEKPRVVTLEYPISIREFSQQTGIKAQSILMQLLTEGMETNINAMIDKDTIVYLADIFDTEITFKEEADIEDEFLKEFEDRLKEDENTESRAPIVTFLGHVDHGKTTLLDSIRQTGVVDTESGGITQHTSAYKYKDEITFIDTPGHAAFTEMRSRGASVTDIVVLVVAADDGVMPQTREAYDHAVAADVPIVVAINKVDLPGVDLNRVKGQLSEMGLTPEDWGGKTQCGEVSAITGEGVKDMLELIKLESEILELQANPEAPAHGVVLETNLSESHGIEASMVIKNGTLTRGDDFVCGRTYGRIRALNSPERKSLQKAGPSTPVIVSGFNEEPLMGDNLYVTEDIQKAKSVAEKRMQSASSAHIHKTQVTMATLFENIKNQDIKELNIILKADAKGSIEAILNGIDEIGNEEVAIRVVHSGVGGINESDVMLADASNAIIIGFHVSAEAGVLNIAEEKGVEIRRYHVIYEIFKELEEALTGMLEPEKVEENIGMVEVRKVFSISKVGNVAGCYVSSGLVKKSSKIRVLRDNIEIYDGSIESLKRAKNDVPEVKEGFECGIKVADFDDIKEGDKLEVYQIREIERSFNSSQ